MKRQPKPFAVEIKRSRKSPAAPVASPTGAPEPDAGSAGEAPFPQHFTARSPDADLVIPAFLQSAKDVRRPSIKERSDANATDRDRVFAPPPPVSQDQPEDRVQPRVLPSLIPAQTFDQDDYPKKTRQPRSGRVSTDNAAAKKAEPKRKTDAPASRVAAGDSSNGRKAPPSPSPSETPELKFEDIAPPPQLTRSRMFLNLRRVDATTLPLGQRWKRRLHPRAW